MNKILYGKDVLDRVISIEVKDKVATIFRQEPDGSVSKIEQDNDNWVLSANKLHTNSQELQGNLNYKYITFLDKDSSIYQFKKVHAAEDLFSISNPKERFMVANGITYHKGLKHDEVSILSFDIETTTLEHTDDAKILLIANTFRSQGQLTKKMFAYDDYKNQGEMLKAWCNWIQDVNPAIITGYNINLFDIPYINFIAQENGVKLNLGRDNSNLRIEQYTSKFRKDGSQFYDYNKPKIFGREVIDGLFLALKYDIGRKYENYKLKSIIAEEGLEKEGRTFYDANQIRYKYMIPEEWAKIKAYAADDGDDALAIYDLMSAPQFYFTQMVPKSFQSVTETATGSQINSIMVRSYLQEGHSLPKASEKVPFEGAISIGNPGIFKNVFKIDVASLYPSIMIQYEVYSPEKDPNKNFLTLVKVLTERRLEHKKLAKETGDTYYKNLEQSEKIGINSAYGFLGAIGLLFNAPEKAAFITSTGREILETAINWCEGKGYKLVNADTDSISFSKGDESHFTKEERQSLLNDINSMFPEKIKWEDDGFYKTLICLAAKNYVLETEDGKVKYKGSSLKDQKKEPALINFIHDIINSILNDKRNYLEIYESYIKEIMNVTDIKRWASKKTITSKVMQNTRTNEAKIRDCIIGSEYKEGDKIYTFYNNKDELVLVENFNKDYNKEKLLSKLYKTTKTFETIIDEKLFVNYSLKGNKMKCELLFGNSIMVIK